MAASVPSKSMRIAVRSGSAPTSRRASPTRRSPAAMSAADDDDAVGVLAVAGGGVGIGCTLESGTDADSVVHSAVCRPWRTRRCPVRGAASFGDERLVALGLQRVRQRPGDARLTRAVEHQDRRPAGGTAPPSSSTSWSSNRRFGRRGRRGRGGDDARPTVADRTVVAVVDRLQQHDAENHRDRDERRTAVRRRTRPSPVAPVFRVAAPRSCPRNRSDRSSSVPRHTSPGRGNPIARLLRSGTSILTYRPYRSGTLRAESIPNASSGSTSGRAAPLGLDEHVVRRAGGRDRTDGLRFTRPLLCQLSYSGVAAQATSAPSGRRTAVARPPRAARRGRGRTR